MDEEELEKIMKIELKGKWKLELHPDWNKKGWEGEALKQSKTIVLFFNKNMDCFHGFLHELAHSIQIEKGPNTKPGESHDVFYADTLTKLIGKYCIGEAKVMDAIDFWTRDTRTKHTPKFINQNLKKELGIK